ncbi:FecR domain-containing protein [Caulobacter sp. SL161]|uniref:FecR family protein n=1 Tax=Caulobacter sp. SL161 TaxID=2995156 RepID=UPI00227680D2|nr:FecR domain-containing protein [Caulobacter sp. SL161]MCY1646624.1 FecR domain-containing protein [Caulobacter sp. SL161]
MNATAVRDPDIERQAQGWAMTVFGERLSAERAEDLRLWLEADPRHAIAYDRAEQLMLALHGLDPDDAVDKARAPGKARRWVLAAALPLAACLVIGLGLTLRPAVFESGRTIRTVALTDGSTAVLAPETRLRRSGWLNGRRYALEQGRALFDVRHASNKRFEVDVGDAKVTVLGTRFDLRRTTSGDISVAVERGRVAVRRNTGGPPFDGVLTPGDSVTLDAAGAQRSRVADPNSISAWRAGQLSFISTRLTDVADDINRFSAVRIAVDPGVRDLRVTASFRATQSGAFVASLPALLPVEVSPRADGVLVVAGRNGNASAPR